MTNVVLPALQIDGGGHVSGFSLAEYNGTISVMTHTPIPTYMLFLIVVPAGCQSSGRHW